MLIAGGRPLRGHPQNGMISPRKAQFSGHQPDMAGPSKGEDQVGVQFSR